MLKVKEYLEEKSGGSISERINEAFAKYLASHDVQNIIILKPDEVGCIIVKLPIQFTGQISYEFLSELHTWLVDLVRTNDDRVYSLILKEIIAKAIPKIIDSNDIHMEIFVLIKLS